MTPANGLWHAIGRVRRWLHAPSHTPRYRARGHARQRVATELDAMSTAMLDIYRRPPARR